jgi:hypothetical protein
MIRPIEKRCRDERVRIYAPQADLVQQPVAADGAARRRLLQAQGIIGLCHRKRHATGFWKL